MEYHNYLVDITFNRSDMQDGYYAVPASFCNFDPVTGDAIFEFNNNEDGTGDEIVPEGFVYIDESDEDDAYRILALRLHLDDWDHDMTVHGRSNTVDFGKQTWLVVTDSEADDAWDTDLQSYIDDCLEIPDRIRCYFDEEKWKRDAKIDGRGHSLSSYDGNEESVSTNNGTYYLFRRN